MNDTIETEHKIVFDNLEISSYNPPTFLSNLSFNLNSSAN